jgi:hypothetical protein
MTVTQLLSTSLLWVCALTTLASYGTSAFAGA